MPHEQQHISDTVARAEAFLLAEGGAMPLRKLSSLLGVSELETRKALDEVAEMLAGSGLSLLQTDNEASLSTAPRVADALRSAFQATLSRDIGNAGLEVLAVLLYRGPSTRARIDYIRGVNTSSTIRLLLSRGLVERTNNPDDAREYIYRPTVEALAHLGIRTPSELDEYATIRDELSAFEKSQSAFEDHGDSADTDISA